MVDTSSSSDIVSLRNFVVDEDRANLGSDLWKSLDKNSFILAQRDAIEAYNLSRAIRLSEESAKNEHHIRLTQAEEAARSLARSWNVDGLQSALLKNTCPPPRPILKRGPSTADNPSNTPSSSKASSPSGPAQQKRRKASISSQQPHYSYSTSNYSQSHNQSTTHSNGTDTGTSQPSSAPPQQQFERRSSASSRDIQAGQILNPKESSPQTQSASSSASAQAAAAEREKEKGKGKERSRSNSSSNSNSSSRKSSSSTAYQIHGPQARAQAPPPTQSQPQSQAQTQQQQQQQHAPRDIFSPVRFNCEKCGILISSVILSKPSLALTSPDPIARPFTSTLHVICNNPSCGAVHCRGCLQIVRCRDVEHPSSSSADSQALVPISSPPASTSPTRLTFNSSKSHQHIQTQAQGQRACVGGPGCALWSCCPTVRIVAVWEALHAFDALFGAEAGFQVPNQQEWKAGQGQQGQGDKVGRLNREAYVRMVISSKADKSMKKFEDGFVRVLKVVASWLQVPGGLSSADDRQQSTILDSDDESQSPDTLILLHLARLLLSSHLLEVVHTFLSNRNVKDWMTHAETYLDVLDVVGKMMDCGLGFLLKEVSGVAPSSPSASAPGFYNPFAAIPPSLPSTLSLSPSQSPPPITPLSLSFASPSTPQPPPTLYDLVSQLETYRGDLKKFLTKVSFGVTVDKASKLHEAITYLVLQLVVGEF